MFTVVLVDDELGIAEGVRFLLEKSELDVEVTAIAGDGREGIRVILENQPDIVISDVRMPVLDGLEMIRKLKTGECKSRFVMLSGYSEFEYAKQAMSLGVKDYICKPVEIEELYEVIGKLCAEIEEERAHRQKLDNLEHQMLDYRKDRRELLFRCFLEGEGRLAETEELFGKTADAWYCRCAIWEINSELLLTTKEFEDLTDKLRNAFREYAAIEILRQGMRAVLILLSEQKMDRDELYLRMTGVRQQLYLESDRMVSIGIGKEYHSLEMLADSYQEAVRALQNKVIFGIGAMLFYEELEREKENRILISEEEILRLEGCMGRADTAGCRQVIHQIFRGLKAQEGLTVTALQIQSLNIILSGLRTMPLMQFQLNEYLGKNILSLESVSRFESIDQMENWVINTVTGILELKKQEKKPRDVIGQIKEYIQDHFTNEISLNEIAGKFYLNPYYLSQLFKKKTGMTYQSYVTMLRIEKAKTLLMEAKKVYEVCELVGYSDQAYFSKVFERTVGCRPSEYGRREGNPENE